MQIKKINPVVYKISMLFLILGSIYFFSKTSHNYYTLITSPYQQEYRETVTSLATQLLLDNKNPYQIENQPEYAQAYGIIQNIIAYPFAYLFGSSLQTHRLVTLIGILLSCLVVILWLRRLEIPLLVSFAGLLTLYLSFFYNVLPINRPDSWGLFFMLTSIYIPFKYNYSSKSLMASIILGLIAFYTKSYFALGIVSVGSFVFFFISKKKGLIYTLIFLVTFALSIYVISYIYPLFFYLTILSFLNYPAENGWAYANMQALTFLYVNKFLILLFFINIFLFFYLKIKNNKPFNLKTNINFIDFDKGLIITRIHHSTLLIIYTTCLFFIIVHVVLGKNDGAFLTYYFTHITPFFILTALVLLYKFENKLIISFGILLLLLNSWSVDRLLYSPFLTENEDKNWKKTISYIESSSHVIGSPTVSNLIKENNLQVYEQGLSLQFVYAANVKKPILKSIFPRYKEIDQVSKQFYHKIDSNIINQNFDLIVNEKDKNIISNTKLITKYYTKIDTLTLAMPFTGQYYSIEFWKPKND
ncbi:ArnT family glycosyltransferase [Bernardetia sp. OM2101]|uniref:ArnT family glycosyltransferase n=1 Tax=Bernardetia sp. OM2101 TaxID=3344876 RepID=UPI0035CEC3A0